MNILIINGPNINMLGIREVNIYGKENYQTLVDKITSYCTNKNYKFEIYQSNYEGDIVTKIQNAYFDKVDGIVINPAAYTHTSVAILDTLKAVNIPCVEVHISKVSEREDFRQISYVSNYAFKTIQGEGLDGYIHAIKAIEDYYECKTK